MSQCNPLRPGPWHEYHKPTTVSASFGTLPVLYTVDELQNPLPGTTMLFEGNRNREKQCRSKLLRASAIDSTLNEGGRGLTIIILRRK